MTEHECPGWPADWLNGWLAALGTTVLVPSLTLRWTDEPGPIAVIAAPGDDDPFDLIHESWPTQEAMADWPIARDAGSSALPLNPSVEEWKQRVAERRDDPCAWMLSSLYTDGVWSQANRSYEVGRGQLHPPAPTGRTIHDRLMIMARHAVQLEDVAASALGRPKRISGQGLGFDLGRISSMADSSAQLIDPVTELLAFFGLALLPVRFGSRGAVQRGVKDRALQWFAWTEPLDRWGIDAALDAVQPDRSGRREPRWPTVVGRWESRSFRAQSTMDTTRGHGAVRRP